MSCKICYPPKEYESAELNEALACSGHGDYSKAFQVALPFAEQGITVAQCLVGVLYQTGMGGEVNGHVAETWLRKAGEGGCALAWHNLSTLYVVGAPGIERNREEAMECQRKAYENGFDLIAPENQDNYLRDSVQ